MLTFQQLKDADLARCREKFGGLDRWTLTDWTTALAGEVGELCNVVKKIRRLQTNPDWLPPAEGVDLKRMAADELADVIIYADLLAQFLGLNLEEAVVRKFNEVSAKVNSTVRLGE